MYCEEEDDSIVPRKRYKFGNFTFVKPDPNFKMPRLFCCNNTHTDGVYKPHVQLDVNESNKGKENNKPTNLLNNVNKRDDTKNSKPQVVIIPSTPKLPPKLPINYGASTSNDSDVPSLFKQNASTIVSRTPIQPQNAMEFEDDFFDDSDFEEVLKEHSKLIACTSVVSKGDDIKEDTKTSPEVICIDDSFEFSDEFPYPEIRNKEVNDEILFSDDDDDSRDDMHGKFRGFLVDDGDEFQNESDHLKEEVVRHMYTYLKRDFGHDDFRHRQKAAVIASLAGNDVFILMPTGAGKSLCYQLPAAIEHGVTVVISPLRALIDDQCKKMNSIAIKTEKLTSDVSSSAAEKIIAELVSHKNNIKLLYVTPEKIAASPRFMSVLKDLNREGRLRRFVIDEAHCVSQWGHDFRPDYAKLKTLRDNFNVPRVPIMALTATATPKIVTDTQRLLGMTTSKLFLSSFVRTNLKYDVVEKSAANTKKLIESVIKQYPVGSGVLFCFSKNDCSSTKKLLDTLGVSSVIYHAGLSDKERREAQEKWMSGKARIVCATIAFGMGIDKPDVRFVIHMSMPKSIEGYYQESGRAGRDGLPSYCAILYNYTDCVKLRRFVEDDIDNGDGTVTVKSDIIKKMHHDNINEMIAYCESVSVCQRKLLVEHFGEIYDSADCLKDPNTVCRNCGDRRKGKYVHYDMTDVAITCLESIKQMSLTVKQLSECLRGKSKLIEDKGKKQLNKTSTLVNLPMYGKAPYLTDNDACRFMIKLITDGYALEDVQAINYGSNSTIVGYVRITDEGNKFLSSINKTNFYIYMPQKIGAASNGALKRVLVEEAEAQKEKYKIKHKYVYDKAKVSLNQLRATLAKDENFSNVTRIFTDKAIDQLAAILPRTNTELLSIDQMTPFKVKKYGSNIMSTLKEFWELVDKDDHAKMTRELEILTSNANQLIAAPVRNVPKSRGSSFTRGSTSRRGFSRGGRRNFRK
uniref:ATP-dependent DNA helicase n=1 Tax=Parastrongyloides trichosuri TaxID=131310 RepID=A0A0N4Z4D0_PARTI